MAKSLKEFLAPILFIVEGVFWLAITALGGAALLGLAALAFLASGTMMFVLPSNWLTRPLAGASALFGLTLALYQTYEATTLSGTALSTLGLSSAAVFGLFVLVSIYLELSTLSMGRSTTFSRKV